ncbi:hypothetical protein BGZ60DRAFT_374304 [Tricladium varicosporioides]|nr:hypothetical protein BGZ60DRAFT_374304 [Hymenoscyphus varicosporioides]
MNALTEIPSFVIFKEAHLIQGKSAEQFTKAWADYDKKSESGSEFPNPKQYTRDSLFLAIELGDAGVVLDELKLCFIEEVWDIILGTVMALARAEMDCKFEHRDLHENNICILRSEGKSRSPTNHSHDERYGYSGLEMSLIDFGLSRATLNDGDTVFYNLEEDLSVFQAPDGHPQFNAYKKMRTHLFTGTRTMNKKAWHNEASKMLNNGHYWSEYTPYTNVIWIHYLLNYLKKKFKADTDGQRQSELSLLEVDMREFTKRLDARTKTENGAFTSAIDCFTFAIEQGWYPEELINANQSAILEQSNIASFNEESNDNVKTFVTNEWIKEEAGRCVKDGEDENNRAAVRSENEAGEEQDDISQGGKSHILKGKHTRFGEDPKGNGKAGDSLDDAAETKPCSAVPTGIPAPDPSSGRTTRAAARRTVEEESSGESNWRKLGRIRQERRLP